MLHSLEQRLELPLALAIYVAPLAVAAAELFWPRRRQRHSLAARWTTALGLHAVNLSLVPLLAPVSALVVASWASQRSFGLLPALGAPDRVVLVATVLGLDLWSYALHRLFHAVPLLWRLHRVHHADLDVDFSTGLRQHPVAVLFTAVFLLPAVAVLGPPPAAVLLFFVLHTTASAYAHGNVRLPHRLERALRALLVTPTMHVVHHSAEAPETDRNFGEIFSLWDRLFGTYLTAPRAGIQTMPIGLETFRSARDLWLDRTLTIPFRSGAVDDARA